MLLISEWVRVSRAQISNVVHIVLHGVCPLSQLTRNLDYFHSSHFWLPSKLPRTLKNTLLPEYHSLWISISLVPRVVLVCIEAPGLSKQFQLTDEENPGKLLNKLATAKLRLSEWSPWLSPLQYAEVPWLAFEKAESEVIPLEGPRFSAASQETRCYQSKNQTLSSISPRFPELDEVPGS